MLKNGVGKSGNKLEIKGLEWQLTKRLRQIRNARHFWFALNLVFTAQWFRLGGNVAHYLTRRYVLGGKMIDTARTRIEVMSSKHASDMLAYQLENREHLAPWSPLRTDEFYTLDNWLSQCKNSESAFEKGSEVKFVALDKDAGEIVGVCSFTGIARGVFQACFLGYSISRKFEGQGYMTEILEASIGYMFDIVGLNRIMATYMPHNVASERVLLKLGFEKEGVARKYLKIAGQWEDHILTSKLNERT